MRQRRTPPHFMLSFVGVLLSTLQAAMAKPLVPEPTQEMQSREQRAKAIEKLIAEFEKQFVVNSLLAAKAMDAQGHPLDNLIFVDTRSHAERLVSKIPGSISLSEFREQGKGKANTNKTFVFYCTIGYRSSQVVQRLAQEKMKAVNLRGGLLSWIHAGGQLVDKAGKPTKLVHVYGTKWNILAPDFTSIY